jgi:predicted nucleic acid-binding protein
MSDRVFVDTNILIYALSDDPIRSEVADKIVYGKEDLIISTQVLNEFADAAQRKKYLTNEEVQLAITDFISSYTVILVGTVTILSALRLQKNYMLSYWDALIVATALEANCSMLFTEDMQNGLLIKNTLTIRNPFA